MPGERGDHCVARFVRCARASESGRFESISAPGDFLLQNLRPEDAYHPQWRFSARCGIFAAAWLRSRMAGGGEFRGLVLNVPLSSVIWR